MATFTDRLHQRIADLIDSGDLVARLVDDDDTVGLAEARYELRSAGDDEILAALDADEIRYAYPVVTWRGREYPGGTVLATEDPANPHDVLTLVDAIVDSFVGGQFDAIYEEVR